MWDVLQSCSNEQFPEKKIKARLPSTIFNTFAYDSGVVFCFDSFLLEERMSITLQLC